MNDKRLIELARKVAGYAEIEIVYDKKHNRTYLSAKITIGGYTFSNSIEEGETPKDSLLWSMVELSGYLEELELDETAV